MSDTQTLEIVETKNASWLKAVGDADSTVNQVSLRAGREFAPGDKIKIVKA